MRQHEAYLAAKMAANPDIHSEYGDYDFTIHFGNVVTQKTASLFIIKDGEAGERQIDAFVDFLTGKTDELFSAVPYAENGAGELIYQYRRYGEGRTVVTTGKSREINEAEKQRLREFATR